MVSMNDRVMGWRFSIKEKMCMKVIIEKDMKEEI